MRCENGKNYVKRCKTVIEIAAEAMKIVEEDRASNPDEKDAEYFFRGESMNFHYHPIAQI